MYNIFSVLISSDSNDLSPHSHLLLTKNSSAFDLLRPTNSGHLYQGASPTDSACIRNPAPSYHCDGFATPTSADASINTQAESFRHLGPNHASTSLPTPDSSPPEASGAANRSLQNDVASDDFTSVALQQTTAVKEEREVTTESHETSEYVKS